MRSNQALLLKAIAFAAEKHRHQRRKDPEASPYINHPIDLANVLLNEGGVSDTTTLCAAILHDTLEDTQTTSDEIAREFGGEIRDIVIEVQITKNSKSASARNCRSSTAALFHACKTGENRRQNLQPARCCDQPACALAAQTPDRIFRLGEGGDRQPAWRASASRSRIRRGLHTTAACEALDAAQQAGGARTTQALSGALSARKQASLFT
jgi:hypothetical protein